MKSSSNKYKGFGIIEILLSIGITLSATVFGVNKYIEYKETERAQIAGEQLFNFNTAISNAMTANYTDISSHCGTAGCTVTVIRNTDTFFVLNNGSSTIEVPSLLPSGFPLTNSYGGTYTAEAKLVGSKLVAITALNLDDKMKKYSGEIVKYAGAKSGQLDGANMVASKNGFTLSTSGFNSVTTTGDVTDVLAAAESKDISIADIRDAESSGSLVVTSGGSALTYIYPVTVNATAPTITYIPHTGAEIPSTPKAVVCATGYVWKAGVGCTVPCSSIFLN